MTATELERAQALAGVSAPVHWHEVTGSTNAIAVELAEAGAPQWTLVGAGHQTAGRGRHGRTWLDRPGAALMTSLVLRPAVAPEALGLLTLLAGAAWAESAREIGGLDVRCKWPNDLLVGEAKAGGVLASSSVAAHEVRWVVLGSGLNLGAPDVEGATGLGEVDRVALLGGFLVRVRRALASPPSRWPARSWHAGAPSRRRSVGGSPWSGSTVRGSRASRRRWMRSGGSSWRPWTAPPRWLSEEVEHLR